jgi:hypothetical protein
VYDLAPLMAGLLSVPPNGTDGVPKEGTPTVPPNGTDSEHSKNRRCPDPGSEVSRSGVQTVPNEGTQGTRKEPNEGTSYAAAGAASVPNPEFALEAPKARTQRRKRNGPRANHEHTAEQREAFTHVRDAYFESVETKTGSKPPSFDGAEGQAIYRLLRKCRGDREQAASIVKNAVLSDFGGSTSLRVIAGDPNRFSTLQKRGNGKPERFVQRGGYDVQNAGKPTPWE